jgi:hypothetical protein
MVRSLDTVTGISFRTMAEEGGSASLALPVPEHRQ